MYKNTAQSKSVQSKHISKLRETATRWFVRMQHAEPDHPDRGRFEAWLMSSPAHATEYAAVADVWHDFDSTKQLQTLANAMEQKKFTEQRTRSNKIQKSAAAVFTVLIITVASLLGFQSYQEWQAEPTLQVAVNTNIGVIKQQSFADGSKLTINANSDVQVTYYRNKRMVQLNRGEVIFEVAKDAERPFIVDTAHAKVTVLGTRFVVNRLNKLSRISVDHGSVKVEAQANQDLAAAPAIVLHDGEVAEVNATQPPQRIARNAANAFSLTQGIINFEQADLEEIAETLSRYRQTPVHVNTGNQQGKVPHITAVVKIAEIEGFINVLPHIAPVQIERHSNETLLSTKAH